MSTIWDNFVDLFAALAYYVKAAVAVLVGNPVLLIVSVFLLLTAGKSLSVGSLLKARG